MQELADTAPAFLIALASCLLGLFIGTAFGPVAGPARYGFRGIRLEDARREANALTTWRIRGGVSTRSSEGGSDDEIGQVALVGVLVVLLVTAYARHARLVANVLVIISIWMAIAAVAVFVTLKKRDVIAGRGWSVALLLGLTFALTGTVDAIWLIYPHVGQEYLQRLLSLESGQGIFSDGLQSFLFVTYQALGVLFFLGLAVVYVALILATVTAVYIYVGAVGRPLWLVTYWATSWSLRPRVFVLAAVFSLFSLLLTSGVGQNFLFQHMPVPPSSVPPASVPQAPVPPAVP
jgi:hypothetical protein